MKRKILGAVLGLFLMGNFYAQESVVTERELPIVVKKSIAKYFGKKKISNIVKDVEDGRVVYDLYFGDQTEAEFTKGGELKEAKNYRGLPSTAIPAKLQVYVKKNYPNSVIVKWEKNRNKQEVELNNGLELEFSLNGEFLRVDR